MQMQQNHILNALTRLGERVEWEQPIEILLIGGAAGMITGLLAPDRTTLDCDVIDYAPAQAKNAVERAARQVASEMDLPANWLSSQAQQLDILPDGWRNRRQHVGTFGRLRIYAIGRMDLLATKCYANRPEDREDIMVLKPTAEDLGFVRSYLTMLRVPRRQANLDQVIAALRLVDALEQEVDDA